MEVSNNYPDVAEILKIRKNSGQPRVEDNQPELLKVITDIALFGGAADDRRRSEVIRSCRTLDDLCLEVCKLGYNISRSGLYLRLLPKRANSEHGKTHVVTVPVKLCRPHSDLHKKHEDGMFCTATLRNAESLTSILGPDQVFFLSLDDKARVPLGITAAKAEASILMHLEYRVQLPDHDFVVAEKHKLIPFVYAAIEINKNGEGQPNAVTYSGPTYVAIRSGKHTTSNAETHAADINSLVDLPEFRTFIRTAEGSIKPVFVFTSDGGPDENPRYERVIGSAIQHFKKFNLDAIYIATNAPGRSAFNRVERRMAPLSRELTGLILKHDNFGSHLNSSNETIDVELENKYFKSAGKVLSEIWSKLVIDNFPVIAEYVAPKDHPHNTLKVDAAWYALHVRESQYILQIVKCSVEECCGIRRSSLWNILPDGFLPPPAFVKQTSTGYKTTKIDDLEGKFAPLLLQLTLKLHATSSLNPLSYDFYCSSVQTYLAKRSCKICGLYFASYKSAHNHIKFVHKKPQNVAKKVRPLRVAAKRAKELLCLLNNGTDALWLDEEDVDTSQVIETNNNQVNKKNGISVITNVHDWCVSPWTEESTH